MFRELEPEEFLYLHMDRIADVEIPQDNLPALFVEIKGRVRDLQESIIKNETTEIVWELGAYVAKYAAEICDFYENIRR